jgi:hypothetical protein
MPYIRSLDICPLCNCSCEVFYNSPRSIYYICRNCYGIFLSKDLYLSEQEEHNRYLEHRNDVDDPRYQAFVSPITRFVMDNFDSKKHKGLDFGAGSGPVISKVLTDQGFCVDKYDPFFYPDRACLGRRYDFVVCCEVIEHFHRPYEEFMLLSGLLQEQGKLICMTNIYNQGVSFENWNYKNDPTHVFLYQKETFEWIKKGFYFSSLQIKDNISVLGR